MKNIIIIVVVIALVVFSGGFIFYKTIEANSNRSTQNNLVQAKRIYDAIPVWHKKIQTYEDLKIGIITDTHVHPNRVDKTNKADDAPRYLNEKYIRVLNNFVLQMAEFQPEFIVHLGDVIEGTNDEDFVGVQGIKLVKNELDKVSVPIHWVVGNHDLRSLTKEQFKETLNLDSLNQVFDKGDYRFIIIDANYNIENLSRTPTENRYIPGKLPPHVIDWFKEKLETDKRVFVFMHQGPFLDNSIGDDGPTKRSIINAEELNEILKEYRVDGIFNGHIEARRYEKSKFTNFYSLIGTKKSKTYPQSYYELTITDGEPDVAMFYVPTDSTEIRKVDFESGEK